MKKGQFISNTYNAIHLWVKKNKGKATTCEKCGSSKSVHWANKSHEYKREIDDWIPLCLICHRRYDLDENGRKRGDTAMFGMVKYETRKDSKLNRKQVKEIFTSTRPDVELSKKYNLGSGTVSNIRSGKRFYKYTRGLLAAVKKPTYIKLSKQQAEQIRVSNLRTVDLAAKYEVSESTISMIKHNKRWQAKN